jgi:hypothetical protein
MRGVDFISLRANMINISNKEEEESQELCLLSITLSRRRSQYIRKGARDFSLDLHKRGGIVSPLYIDEDLISDYRSLLLN